VPSKNAALFLAVLGFLPERVKQWILRRSTAPQIQRMKAHRLLTEGVAKMLIEQKSAALLSNVGKSKDVMSLIGEFHCFTLTFYS
jgi:hypothetical protein